MCKCWQNPWCSILRHLELCPSLLHLLRWFLLARGCCVHCPWSAAHAAVLGLTQKWELSPCVVPFSHFPHWIPNLVAHTAQSDLGLSFLHSLCWLQPLLHLLCLLQTPQAPSCPGAFARSSLCLDSLPSHPPCGCLLYFMDFTAMCQVPDVGPGDGSCSSDILQGLV